MKIIAINSVDHVNLDMVTQYTLRQDKGRVSLKMFFGGEHIELEVHDSAENERARHLRLVIGVIVKYFQGNMI